MSQVWGWVAEVVLGLLLLGTLGMTVKLDRALRSVRRDRTSFEALISNLGAATNAVKVGIQALRNEADRAAGQIERRSEEADKMATDLSFLIEAADRAGAKLEERLLAFPKDAVVESQPLSVVRRLAAAGQFLRRRRSPVSTVGGAPAKPPPIRSRADESPSLDPVPAERVAPATPTPVPAPPILTPSPPAGLRERAGITTRRRGASHTAAPAPAQAASILETVIVAETGEERTLVKMVG
ncbi:MAG: hypothetical protein H7Z10_07525 [Gemmatimonadaceae bacterium]|nr:hypothetical protein [Acetobacteraceae bacterium]